MSSFEHQFNEQYLAKRQRMVRDQLHARGIRDQRVLDAVRQIPREEFVARSARSEAYENRALSIDCGQTISQPYTVAVMCEAATLDENDAVLEIGAGSGYGAAVLSRLCRVVHTVERLDVLAQQAKMRLKRLGIENVHVHCSDGSLGLQQESPFDAILVTAGAPRLPQPLIDQLRDGGRIVAPIGSANHQSLYRYTSRNSELTEQNLGAFVFVPLIGQHGWPERSHEER